MLKRKSVYVGSWEAIAFPHSGSHLAFCV
ncbi:rCG57321 [Rattus norvegicus]|uniref:RCG57321 n=1 Tax=Rattus norvegicus TaxID=10116 RepID=A6JPB6_RAT|nr:rCG57321 [Rattus norvegicus]